MPESAKKMPKKSVPAMRQLYVQSRFERPEDAIGFWLWRAAHSYQRIFDQAMEPLGLTHLQFVMLAVCGWITGAQEKPASGATQRDIAEMALVHFAQVSAVLKTLEQKGLISQARDGKDARRRSIRLTAAGAKKLGEALPLAQQLQQTLFGTAEQQEEVRSRLRDLIAGWSQLEEQTSEE